MATGAGSRRRLCRRARQPCTTTTPAGRIARYFYGIDYAPDDLRLGLVEASSGTIGSPVDQILLFCYHYDPATGKYDLLIRNILWVAVGITALALGAFVLGMRRRERRLLLKIADREQRIESRVK